MSGLQQLVFRDGSRLWWAPMADEGAAASDHIAKVLESHSHSAATISSNDARILLQDIHFDPACCVGCEKPAEGMASVEARRGFHALLASSFIVREVPVPACARCVFKRRVRSAAMIALPILTFCLTIKVGSAWRVGAMDEPAIAIWAAVALLPALVVVNVGYRVVDDFGLGVAMGTLDATQARAPIYVRREAARKGLRNPG